MRAALALKPGLTEARLTLGEVLDTTGRPAAAHAEYQRAVDSSPELAEPHVALGGSLLRRGEHAAAADELRRAGDRSRARR